MSTFAEMERPASLTLQVKKQYQGIDKELIKWCSKSIVRFLSGVICQGDEFETDVDFETGLEKSRETQKNNSVDRNKLENIIGAYKIAYVLEDGKLVQYPVVIDKNRIMRAYNASPTNEKTYLESRYSTNGFENRHMVPL